MAADERTPLVRPTSGRADSGGSGPIASKDADGKSRWGRIWGALKVENRILLAGFLITLSFSFTQVP
jgi:hypothetical protein